MPAPRFQWTLADAPSTRGRIFRRPLDPAEHGFVWYGHFNGTGDCLQYAALLRLCDDGKGPFSADLFSEANITQAWLSTKRRYPLAGGILVPRGEAGSSLSISGSRRPINCRSEALTQEQAWGFVMREEDLDMPRPGEAQRCAVALMQHDSSNPRLLSDELLAQLYVFREAKASGSPSALHVVGLKAHCITDVTADHTFFRCFIDTLARGERGDVSVLGSAQVLLKERLRMAIPIMELEPAHIRALGLAKRRWRRAVGQVIFQLGMAKRQARCRAFLPG